MLFLKMLLLSIREFFRPISRPRAICFDNSCWICASVHIEMGYVQEDPELMTIRCENVECVSSNFRAKTRTSPMVAVVYYDATEDPISITVTEVKTEASWTTGATITLTGK